MHLPDETNVNDINDITECAITLSALTQYILSICGDGELRVRPIDEETLDITFEIGQGRTAEVVSVRYDTVKRILVMAPEWFDAAIEKTRWYLLYDKETTKNNTGGIERSVIDSDNEVEDPQDKRPTSCHNLL